MPRRLALGNAQDLVQAERDIRARIGDSELDFAAMAAVSNIYRAANAIRNHMEQQVLADEDLSWAAFTVLFVLWIWGDQQTRHLAAEAGVTKGTLTGVLKTLEKRGLARRRGHDADGRLVLVSLEPKGQDVIERLFPAFNRGEARVSAGLAADEKDQLASLLRTIIRTVEEEDLVRLETRHGGLVPFQAVAGHVGQVQPAVPDLERAGQHRMGPVLPLQPLPGRGDPEQVPGDLGVQVRGHRQAGHLRDRGGPQPPGHPADPHQVRHHQASGGYPGWLGG